MSEYTFRAEDEVLRTETMVRCEKDGSCSHTISNSAGLNQHTVRQNEACFAADINHGFTDFTARSISCNASYYVALYCHGREEKKPYQNNLSDIKVLSLSKNGFQTLLYFRSCYPGWFKVNNACLKIISSKEEDNYEIDGLNAATDLCEEHSGRVARELCKNIALTNTTATDSNHSQFSIQIDSDLLIFWKVFSNKQRIGENQDKGKGLKTLSKRLFINSSVLPTSDLKLKWSAYFRYRYIYGLHSATLWSVRETSLELAIDEHIDQKAQYVMCERDLEEASNDSRTLCSDEYRTCDDGTCVHDALWCDGVRHCEEGEDEEACHFVCSSTGIDCITECHIDKHCKCTDTYFQCLSGGCVPRQKVCDMTPHCADASDEPMTCIFTAIKPVIQRLNDVILQTQQKISECFKKSSVAIMPLNGDHFKITKTKVICPPPLKRFPNDMDGVCSDLHRTIKGETSLFPLHQLCIYGNECNRVCHHSFHNFHLQNCEEFYCVGHFKCASSYCVSFDQICNGVCECPGCEDEAMCKNLLCPGLLLLERGGSEKYCTKDYLAFKHKLNRRQIVRTSEVSLTDQYPVLIYINNYTLTFDNKWGLNEDWSPALVTYLSIIDSKLQQLDVTLFHQMVSLKVLNIAGNGIVSIPRDVFVAMSVLEVLNMSNNRIQYIPHSALCPLQALKYFFVENNELRGLEENIFQKNLQLKMIVIHSNKLHPVDTVLLPPYPLILSLHFMSSDLSRFCCTFYKTKHCSPDLPRFMSCSNMIASKSQMIASWVISLSTVLLNSISVMSILAMLILKTKVNSGKGVTLLISMNLSVAEMITSICLLNYPSYNEYFDGVFGVEADRWRYSWMCQALEFVFFVFSQACLAASMLMSAHFAIIIPSIVQQKMGAKKIAFILIVIWAILIGISSGITASQVSIVISPFNYFCLPFITSAPADILVKTIYIFIVSFDCVLICSSIACYIYLFVYIRKQIHNKNLQAIKKRTIALQKFALRMIIVIFSNTLTWSPILLLEAIVLAGVEIQHHIILWILFSFLPVNLLIDPIFVIRNTFKK